MPSFLDLVLPTLFFALSFDLFALPFGFSEIYLSSTISDCLFWVVSKKQNKKGRRVSNSICIDFVKIYQSKLPSLSHGLPSFLGSETALLTNLKSSAAMGGGVTNFWYILAYPNFSGGPFSEGGGGFSSPGQTLFTYLGQILILKIIILLMIFLPFLVYSYDVASLNDTN